MSRFHDDMTLSEARDILRELVDEGHKCPCCTQQAKVYRRKVHASMAVALIKVYRAAGNDWCEVASVLEHREVADFAKLAHWQLIEADGGHRDDGSNRTGWWRVTVVGEAWLKGLTTVVKYARIYDGRCLSLTGESVSITDALGRKFDYQELMAGV